MITFVLSSPGHHFEMMVPVAEALAKRNVASRIVSLAELRGLVTPSADRSPVPISRVLPVIRTSTKQGSGLGSPSSGLRRVVRRALWHVLLDPRLRWLLRGSDAVVIPNDAAWPYDEIARYLRSHHIPFALMQEGVRFPIPRETAKVDAAYGTGGADVLLTWGEASSEHFRSIGVRSSTIHVAGNPRFDSVDPQQWAGRAAALRDRLGLERPPLLYVSSAIDDLGFCTTAEKLALFSRFLAAARACLARERCGMIVKLHPREDAASFRQLIATSGISNVHVVDDQPLFTVLAASQAAVIVASTTVGLEALMFNVPLGALPIPGYGHVFDYVSPGAAIDLQGDDIDAALTGLLASQVPARAREFLERHIAHRGSAAERIATRLIELSSKP